MLPDALTVPATAVAQALVARGQRVAVAESSAGGLISAALLSVPGASAYDRGGMVVYTLDGARAMLTGASDLDPGRRGAADPYGDPPGHAWLAVAGPGGHLEAQHLLTGQDDRVANMQAFAATALGGLAAALA